MWACELIYVVSILSPDEEYTGEVHMRRYIVEPERGHSPCSASMGWTSRDGEGLLWESSILSAVVALVYRGIRRPGSLWSYAMDLLCHLVCQSLRS